MAEAFNDTLKCAYEEATERDIAIGKAVQSLNCPKCGNPLYAVEREKDYIWNCSSVMECDYRRSEPKKVLK